MYYLARLISEGVLDDKSLEVISTANMINQLEYTYEGLVLLYFQ